MITGRCRSSADAVAVGGWLWLFIFVWFGHRSWSSAVERIFRQMQNVYIRARCFLTLGSSQTLQLGGVRGGVVSGNSFHSLIHTFHAREWQTHFEHSISGAFDRVGTFRKSEWNCCRKYTTQNRRRGS
ncbi:hypothetical protein F5Y17DRAFT_392393 [Xylariaceae sp. FL0594]|nr:hypothetical protein F5Y17DRAFT_392393 [Xylariaceae sp. FL0594]